MSIRSVADLEWPTAITTRSDTDALYVTEQLGRVRVLHPKDDGTYDVQDPPMLDLTAEMGGPELGSEAGLLGLAFSPDGSRLYLSDAQFLHDESRENVSFKRRVYEYKVDGDDVDLDSRRTLIELDKPKSNHSAGEIVFGPDGYLYISLGDASPGGLRDQLQTGQDPTDLYAGILRVDPLESDGDILEGGEAYQIPSDNPFADGVAGAPEVYVWGARNPWRFSFDTATGDLWIGDVGEFDWEEITYIPAADIAGANLQWSLREGTHDFGDGGEVPADSIGPIFEYSHDDDGGCAVIGGYVYRGTAIPDLEGGYLYSDYCGRELRMLFQEDGAVVDNLDLGIQSEFSVLSFGQGDDGELFMLTSDHLYLISPP